MIDGPVGPTFVKARKWFWENSPLLICGCEGMVDFQGTSAAAPSAAVGVSSAAGDSLWFVLLQLLLLMLLLLLLLHLLLLLLHLLLHLLLLPLLPSRLSGAMVLAGGIRVNAWVSGGFLPAKVRGTKYEGLACGWDWCGAGISPER